MLQLWRQRPLLVSAFVLTTALTLFFGIRFIAQAVYWANPAHHQQAIEPWMTAGYIGKSWDLDPRALDAQAGLPLPQEKGRPQPLSEIAQDRGIPVADLIAQVEKAVQELKAKEKAGQND